MTATCPWCSAPRGSGTDCPRCGANYAKAEAIKAHGRVPAAEVSRLETTHADPQIIIHADDTQAGWKAVSDPELEFKFCVAAIPMALVCALLFHASGLGTSLQRIFLTMPVHELGHAVTAWFCGYTAIPTLWKTLVPETRGFVAPLLLAGGLGYSMYYAQQTRMPALLCAGGVLLVLQGWCTFMIKPDTTQMLITFGGDAGGMVLATLLMMSFYFGKNTQLYTGSLRWGFLVIGAAAFVDMFATWWKSRRDEGAIPYGTTGGMATDAMKLVDDHSWSLQTLVSRHVTVGVCCLILLALVYAWGVWRAKRDVEAQRVEERREAITHRRRGE